MRLIKQKYSTFCGIACVAMLAEKILQDVVPNKRHKKVIDKAFEILKRNFTKTDSYTDLWEIKKILKEFNVSWQGRFNSIGQDFQNQEKFWYKLKGVNLVAVRFKEKTASWH